jgi:hypothetical protein
MPDLTTHHATACETTRSWTTIVNTHTVRWGRLHGRLEEKLGTQYGYTCECKGFEIRSDCKHVRGMADYAGVSDVQGPDDRCGWDNRFMEPNDASGHGLACPMCEGPTFTYSYGA